MKRDRATNIDAAELVAAETIAILERDLIGRCESLSAAERERMRSIAASIAIWGARFNLTAQPNEPIALARHFLDSLSPSFLSAPAAIGEMFRAKRRVLDIGGGAGFPGLVLAAATAADFTIAESRRHRANFLEVAAREAHLQNVAINARRVNSESLDASYDVVIARALARPQKFWELAASALRAGGLAILWARRGQILDLDIARNVGLVTKSEFEYSLGDSEGERDHMLLAMRRS